MTRAGRFPAGGAFALMFGLCACSPPGKTQKFSTGVPTGVALTALSPGEIAQMCRAYDGVAMSPAMKTATQQYNCKSGGLVASAFVPADQKRPACDRATNDCLGQPVKPVGVQMCDKVPSGCRATVAEFEACVGELLVTLEMAAQGVPSCEMVAAGAASGATTDPLAISAPCRTLDMKCPGYIAF